MDAKGCLDALGSLSDDEGLESEEEEGEEEEEEEEEEGEEEGENDAGGTSGELQEHGLRNDEADMQQQNQKTVSFHFTVFGEANCGGVIWKLNFYKGVCMCGERGGGCMSVWGEGRRVCVCVGRGKEGVCMCGEREGGCVYVWGEGRRVYVCVGQREREREKEW